ncbi:hypothetical protein [Streptomyces sp. H27-D2]|uniref:hypothetical protein n=1 Tax=Streptomyces sp. H27-D2 TaxID=3046304 RepID=UPI002DB970B7|nr:hypothetical protein [Streptomyces sp. H27-D2]MEC4018740.1 hypothetical protein [Streptomyces sp. H27-D2]
MASTEPAAQTTAHACRSEIVRLHDLLAGWLSGETARTPEAFAPFAESHDPGFTLIEPGGKLLARDRVLTEVESVHGAAPGLVIDISEVQLIAESGSLVVAGYEEWHSGPTAGGPRRVTAVFVREPAAPHGLRWRHLHETWLAV